VPQLNIPDVPDTLMRAIASQAAVEGKTRRDFVIGILSEKLKKQQDAIEQRKERG
jgi:hypothetical protein